MFFGVSHFYKNSGITISLEYDRGNSYMVSRKVLISYMMAIGKAPYTDKKSHIAAATICDILSKIINCESNKSYEDTEILDWLRKSIRVVSSDLKFPQDFQTAIKLLESRKHFLNFNEYLNENKITFDKDYFENILNLMKTKCEILNKHQIDIIIVFLTISVERVIKKEYVCCLLAFIISLATKGEIKEETLHKIRTVHDCVFFDMYSVMNFNVDDSLVKEIWLIVSEHIDCGHIKLEELISRLFIFMGHNRVDNILFVPFIEVLIHRDLPIGIIKKVLDKHFTSILYMKIQRHPLFKNEIKLYHYFMNAINHSAFCVYRFPNIINKLQMLHYLCIQIAFKIDGDHRMSKLAQKISCPFVAEADSLVREYEELCKRMFGNAENTVQRHWYYLRNK